MITYAQETSGIYNYWDRFDGSAGYFYAGRKDGNERSGAVRFTGVAIPKNASISSASLAVAANEVAGSRVVLRAYGIDEDNTALFFENPEGRQKTDAVANVNDNLPSTGNFLNIGVTSLVQEIVNRSGWSSGNAMGFWVMDYGSTSDGNYLRDSSGTSPNCRLSITATSVSGSPSGSPSPSPSPSTRMRMRVALPGYDALTDTNPDHFALNSDENWVLIKEKMRGTVSVNANSNATITHNLGYVPFFSVYADREWITGYNIYSSFQAYATTTTLVMRNNSASAKTFAYYIFYDRQL